ncbi:MAG: hypothetical protein ABI356_12400 [Steroidobacteraceae bacterium]
MVLIGPTSSSVDFSPQGLLEKVFTPLVVHTQIRPAAACGSTAVCASSGPGTGAASESGRAGAEAVCAFVAVSKLGGNVVGETADGAAASGGELGAARCIETAAKATAMAAADRLPKIQGSNSRSFFMSRLSSTAMNIGIVRRRPTEGWTRLYHKNEIKMTP